MSEPAVEPGSKPDAESVGDDGIVRGVAGANAGPLLGEVDEVLAEYHAERRMALELQAQKTAERRHFARAASHAFRSVIKPALQAVADRLVEDGVGGLVEERPPSGHLASRLVLWMSLDGPIVGAPRQDRNPYLQLDLDVDARRVRVWEGDMWLHLGSSRPADPLTLDQLTAEIVTDRALDVLRRAAAHGREILASAISGADPE